MKKKLLEPIVLFAVSFIVAFTSTSAVQAAEVPYPIVKQETTNKKEKKQIEIVIYISGELNYSVYAKDKKSAKKIKKDIIKAESEKYVLENEDGYTLYFDTYENVLRRKIVAESTSYVGILPYVWGCHSLEYGADCSGFVSAIYAEFGYNVSTGSVEEASEGRSVSYEELQIGDIVIYGNGEHVGLYIGNNQVVHCPQTGEYVKISDMYWVGNVTDFRNIIS